jgi:hypothetical protein
VKKSPKRSDLKRQFHRMVVAQADISSAKDAWPLWQSNPSRIGAPTYTDLVTAIVICHSRPFTDNESFGKLAQRKKAWRKPAPRCPRGVLAQFAAHVTSASEGAVTDKDLKL